MKFLLVVEIILNVECEIVFRLKAKHPTIDCRVPGAIKERRVCKQFEIRKSKFEIPKAVWKAPLLDSHL